MGHLDRTILDTATLLEFADRGSMLEYDLFGWESSYYSLGDHDMIHDGQRLDYVETADRGWPPGQDCARPGCVLQGAYLYLWRVRLRTPD